MNDLERELRDLLADDARRVPTPDRAPDGLRRRARLRQAAFATLTALSVAALGALAVVGLSALPSRDGGVPADRPTTTQSLNGITITYPEAWHLIDPDEAGLNGPEPTPSLPRLVLALSPQPPSEMLACPGLAEGDAPTFLMTVQERPPTLAGDLTRDWPVTLEPMGGTNATGVSACYPEWRSLEARWIAEGRGFEAVVGLAPEVSDDDREALLAAFGSMTFAPSTEGPPSIVLATGTAGGEDWELIASSDADGLSLTLQGVSFGSGTGGYDPRSSELRLTDHVFGEGASSERVVFAAIPADAVRVEAVHLEGDGASAEVAVLDVPDAIDPDLNAFVTTIDADGVFLLQALDGDGDVVASATIDTEGKPGPVITPELEDGRYFGYIELVDVGGRAIEFDLAYWLSGEEANQAYQEATGETGPVPNDHFVVNDNPKLRTLPLAPDLKLRLLDWNRCCDTFVDGDLGLFAEAIATQTDVTDGDVRYAGVSQYWVTVQDGVVTEIEEQYSP